MRVNSTKSILKENIEEIEKRNQVLSSLYMALLDIHPQKKKKKVLSSLVENLCVKENDLHEKYFEKKKKKTNKQTKRREGCSWENWWRLKWIKIA